MTPRPSSPSNHVVLIHHQQRRALSSQRTDLSGQSCRVRGALTLPTELHDARADPSLTSGAQTIGAVSSDPSWKEEGAEMRQAGEEEVQQAREKAKVEAGGERLWGKAES